MEVRNIHCNKNIIYAIEKNSIAEELGIEVDDILLSINGEEVKDIIDYRFLINDEFIVLEIEKKYGEIWELEIEKDYTEDLGIEFSNPLIDKAKSCKNKCIFCFIDQLPKGMRDTLYFKDDDSRLSFLQGNFITLTNMNEEEIQRIIKYRITPINVSVHTTNPSLRVKMLKNKKAGRIMDYLKQFNEAGLEINCQIVLVPGVNDGVELINTIEDLSKLSNSVKSVAAVPVGITRYRQGLFEINPYTKKQALEVIEIVHRLQRKMLKEKGTRFIFLSDEIYLKAEEKLPEDNEYEYYPQLENGVGLMKSFETEVLDFLEKIKISKEHKYKYKHFILGTGSLSYDFMKKICSKVVKKIPEIKINVYKIDNDFFGHNITVNGLITGGDLTRQLKDKEGDVIIIARNMMKSDELIFLDNYTLDDVEKIFGKKVLYSEIDGEKFVKTFLEGKIQ